MRKQLACLLAFILIFSIIQPLMVMAYVYDQVDYGSGDYNDPVQYKDFRIALNFKETIECPTAAFTVDIGSKYLNSSSTSLESDGVTAINPMYAKVGDTATISTQGTTHGLSAR